MTFDLKMDRLSSEGMHSQGYMDDHPEDPSKAPKS